MEQVVSQEAAKLHREITETLAQRNSTHGDFEDNGRIMQLLKSNLRQHQNEGESRPRFYTLAPHQREALDMIMHKVGRILCGDPNFADHWHDIAGYAKLCEERCSR